MTPPYRRVDGPICGDSLPYYHTCALAKGHNGPHCCNSNALDGCRHEWDALPATPSEVPPMLVDVYNSDGERIRAAFSLDRKGQSIDEGLEPGWDTVSTDSALHLAHFSTNYADGPDTRWTDVILWPATPEPHPDPWGDNPEPPRRIGWDGEYDRTPEERRQPND